MNNLNEYEFTQKIKSQIKSGKYKRDFNRHEWYRCYTNEKNCDIKFDFFSRVYLGCGYKCHGLNYLNSISVRIALWFNVKENELTDNQKYIIDFMNKFIND